MDEPGEKSITETLSEAQVLSDALRHAYRPIPEAVEVSDQTGALTITVEDHGARVTRVTLAADWKNKIASSALGATVMETIYSTRLENFKEFFEKVSTGLAVPSPDPPPKPQPVDIASLTNSLNWDALGEMLETVNKALDAVAAGPATPDTTGEAVSGRSDNRRVEVTLVAGQPTSVTVDDKWAEKAGRQQISDALRQAFESAYAEAVARSAAAPRDGKAVLGELESIMNRFGITR